MMVTVQMRPRSGNGPDPLSGRQRTRATCEALIGKGAYPTIALLKEALPDLCEASMKQYRHQLLCELGMVGRGYEVKVDMSRLARP